MTDAENKAEADSTITIQSSELTKLFARIKSPAARQNLIDAARKAASADGPSSPIDPLPIET
jgi:hypothetical protein